MPAHEIELAILFQNFDDDMLLAEALLFPEVSRFGDALETLKRALIKNALRIIETEALPRVWTRFKPSNFDTFELKLTLDPPAKHLNWREPLELRFDVIRWSHGEAAHVAFIPALGIEVLSKKLAECAGSRLLLFCSTRSKKLMKEFLTCS